MSPNPRRTPVNGPDSRSLTVKTNVTLKKGATFHSPTTPPSSPERVFRPPPLPRRSHTNLDDVIDSHRRRVALTLGDIDKTLAGLPKDDSSSPARKALRDDSLPIPRGVLNHTLDSAMAKEQPAERRVLRPRTRRSARCHESDSGLGTSIASTNEKLDAAKKEKTVKTTTLTRSAAARETSAVNLPGLSPRATSRICEHTLKPLLGNPAFKDFHPLLLGCPKKIQEKQIVCLRDLEKTLLLVAPERTKAAGLYLDFCLTTIRCIQATVEYLSDREQTRPRDVPYSSGYFIDLVDQIRQYAQQLSDAREKDGQDEMDVDPTDEIKLHGGIHINGRPAELVRIKKNGKMISMATGEPVEKIEEEADGSVRIKRSASQELEDEEEIMRSMARRKKNASPEELAPKKCREPGCNKEFKRPCDLTKHEKTHSRPWKCPVPTCKYHEYGWPTEKEMDRHHNDKHSSSPPMFECLYKPCPYKSKRESNCKQHMEKAHGWTYVRTKTNGKKSGSSINGNSAHPTPQLQNIPTPSSEHSMGVSTPPDDWSGVYRNNLDFPTYLPNDTDFMIPQEISLDYSPIDNPTPSTDSGMDHNSAYQDIPTDFSLYEDIYSANVQLPTPMHVNIYNKDAAQQFVPFTAAELCQPQPAQLSPIGQGNAMLYTPTSLAEVDEGFDEHHEFAAIANAATGGDFILFPNGPGVSKPMFNESLFAAAEIPSLTAGYSQPSSQDLLNAFNVDWSAHDLSAYLPH
ncbi:Zinc finger transcription factor ace1 [Madurella mycetomatis]|uniref:Zinc finger transcription factor ace1 n=1 Tax=Madurella mycetomatis TaxID=100816 RepID=A0A175WFP7_9PEZI|nr:Zinc finger transcription factor ace1 [Madurella mycetomatis]KXX81900.1 Zinc finger transcription factor ace1 [Madurella mycetomatis]